MTQITATRQRRWSRGVLEPSKERIERPCLNKLCTNKIFVSVGQIVTKGQFCNECRDSFV